MLLPWLLARAKAQAFPEIVAICIKSKSRCLTPTPDSSATNTHSSLPLSHLIHLIIISGPKPQALCPSPSINKKVVMPLCRSSFSYSHAVRNGFYLILSIYSYEFFMQRTVLIKIVNYWYEHIVSEC